MPACYTCIVTQVRTKQPSTPRQAAACCAPIDGLLDARLFQALSDPTRLNLLACLAKCRRPCSVGEIAACCSVDLSVVSRHLAMLRDAGVLEAEKKGRVVMYRVRHEHVANALRSLADAVSACCAGRGCC